MWPARTHMPWHVPFNNNRAPKETLKRSQEQTGNPERAEPRRGCAHPQGSSYFWLAMRLCSFQLSDRFGACMDLCVGNLLSGVQGLLVPEP